ncbi:amino acid permease [Paracidobacterium acidisoli]|uniref:Amino acid permease n=1 Tax=Paracidobacterium acidisoli TaxID=2303751 RepID=A0A372IUL9_9BACT|nr:amino acid permease [Paracidobacterium acidisoli]MBT9329942.1 amino acid permease [Paracidobacterium acidisoli]
MAKLFAVKPLSVVQKEASDEGEHTLKRSLGPINLITLGVGAIIGAGIFVLTGTAAAQFAGPAIVISFIIAGTGCVFAGLCYAEFAAMIPIAGSAYTYGYTTLGELVAWIIGWALCLEYAFGAATVAVGWSGYVSSLLGFFGVRLPFNPTPSVTLALWGHPFSAKVDIFALAAIIVVSTILVIGVRESANFNSAAVIIKVSVVFIFIGLAISFAFGHWHIMMANWHPFIPKNQGHFGAFGWSGIMRGASVVFFAYIGFDAVSTAAQESRNPQRDLPFGILGSLVLCTLLYIIVAGLLTGLKPYSTLNTAAPVADGAAAIGATWGVCMIDLGAIAGLASVMLVMILGQTRVLYTMSKDGLLPPWVGRIHPRFRTPWLVTIAVGILVAFLAAFFNISFLGELVSLGTLLAFAIVCLGVWVMRVRQPDIPRPFRTPWVPFVPLAGILISLSLMVSTDTPAKVGFTSWLVIGLIIYFSYSVKHSKVRQLPTATASRR